MDGSEIDTFNGTLAGVSAVLTAVIRALEPDQAQQAAAHLEVATQIDGEDAALQGLSGEREAARTGICEAYLALLRARAHG